MGAWIETFYFNFLTFYKFVAPFMGAWIETRHTGMMEYLRYWSLPLWERGLKLDNMFPLTAIRAVAPFMGAWIETTLVQRHVLKPSSLPLWERGLKQRHDV